jgi:SAM-dependent methyltransferase
VTIAPHEDAYGAILLAALEGRDASEVMERDDGTVWCGDGSDYLDPPRRWPPTERRMLRFARGRVLDVGCAAGRVSLLLQERGREVVAIDESPLAVEVARRRGVRDARALSLADVDASLGLFDTVLIVRNNMGLGGPDGAAGLLGRLADITTPRGRLITDSVDPDRIDDAAIREGTAAGGAGVFGQRLRVRHAAFASPWFHYVMTSPDAFAALVEDSPWRIARIVDDGAPRYGVVLEKRPRR